MCRRRDGEPLIICADRGSASLLAVGIMGAIVSLTLGCGLIASELRQTARRDRAADATALAAAAALHGLAVGPPCRLAAQVAAEWAMTLRSCVCDEQGECTVRIARAGDLAGGESESRAGVR